jgi:hypothetical protein
VKKQAKRERLVVGRLDGRTGEQARELSKEDKIGSQSGEEGRWAGEWTHTKAGEQACMYLCKDDKVNQTTTTILEKLYNMATIYNTQACLAYTHMTYTSVFKFLL